MKFREFLGMILEAEDFLKFSEEEKEKFKNLKFKYHKEDETFVMEFYHTELIIRKIKDYYVTELIGVSELNNEEKIFLQSKVFSMDQVKNVIELCSELDALVKKFHYSYM